MGKLSHRTTRVLAIGLLWGVTLACAAVPAYGATTWSLAQDYLARGNSGAPVINDVDGASVWYLETGSAATDPTTYVPFTTWATNYDSWMAPGAPPIKGWFSGTDPFDVPHTSVNSSGIPISCVGGAFIWPAGTVFTHPGLSPITFAVTEWRSPATGTVTLSATLTDAHPTTGGDGVEYWILKGSSVLDHDVVAEAGSSPASVEVPVVAGDSLYLVVGPSGNYGGDTTAVDLSVTLTPQDTTPPVITVNGVTEGYSGPGPLTVTFSATDAVDGPVPASATLNGNPFTSGSTISAVGSYTLVVTSSDSSGNTATVTRHFTIAAPPVVVSTPASSAWSLALLGLLGMTAVFSTRRVKA